MGKRTKPDNWKRIERAIIIRAEYRCECGTFYDCRSNHYGRCPSVDGNRYPLNKKQVIRLRVVQIGSDDDWRPESLIALCLPCWIRHDAERIKRQRQREHTESLEAQMDTLFDVT